MAETKLYKMQILYNFKQAFRWILGQEALIKANSLHQ